jgi:hypothetical protein
MYRGRRRPRSRAESDDSQRSANLHVWPLPDHNDDTYDEDVPQDEQPFEHTVTSSIPHQLDTMQHASLNASKILRMVEP